MFDSIAAAAAALLRHDSHGNAPLHTAPNKVLTWIVGGCLLLCFELSCAAA